MLTRFVFARVRDKGTKPKGSLNTAILRGQSRALWASRPPGSFCEPSPALLFPQQNWSLTFLTSLCTLQQRFSRQPRNFDGTVLKVME